MLDSPQNPRVKGWVKSIKKRELVCIETRHPLIAAIEAGLPLETVLIAEGVEDRGSLRLPAATEVVVASKRVLAALSDTATPPSCLALMHRQLLDNRLSDIGAFIKKLPPSPRLLVLMNLQDPGNVGTLLRSARAFGCHGVVLGQPMVDVFSPKVIRSTAGWHFELPMVSITDWIPLVTKLLQMRWCLTVGQSDKLKPKAYTDLAWVSKPTAIILGNEGQGLEGEQSALPGLLTAIQGVAGHQAEWVTIPTQVESLNVAVSGSILLAHQSAQINALGRLGDGEIVAKL